MSLYITRAAKRLKKRKDLFAAHFTQCILFIVCIIYSVKTWENKCAMHQYVLYLILCVSMYKCSDAHGSHVSVAASTQGSLWAQHVVSGLRECSTVFHQKLYPERSPVLLPVSLLIDSQTFNSGKHLVDSLRSV